MTEFPQPAKELPEGRFLTEEEFLAMKENLAWTNFGMSLAEFTKAWKASETVLAMRPVCHRPVTIRSRRWEFMGPPCSTSPGLISIQL